MKITEVTVKLTNCHGITFVLELSFQDDILHIEYLSPEDAPESFSWDDYELFDEYDLDEYSLYGAIELILDSLKVKLSDAELDTLTTTLEGLV
jgi:hypothetical protein